MKRDISDISFVGSVPENIVNLPELGVLDIAGNQFSGAFPGLVSKGTVSDLDISRNAFTGSLGFIEGYTFLVNLYVMWNFN